MANVTKLKRWYAVVDAKQRIQYIQEIIRTSDIKRFHPDEINSTNTGYRYAIRDTRTAAVEAARATPIGTFDATVSQ